MNKKLPVVLESKTVFNSFLQIRKDTLLYPSQHVGEYYVLSVVKESVVIVATNTQGELIVTREYRHPINQVVFGCPGGYQDPGETFVEAAKRELLEETGCIAEEYRLLATIYPLPGILDQKTGIVHARDVTCVQETKQEPQEIIEWDFMTRETLRQKIQEGAACDGILLSALFFSPC